jgi:hypothetical protein
VYQKRGFWVAAFTPNRNKKKIADVMISNILFDLLFSQNQRLKFSGD